MDMLKFKIIIPLASFCFQILHTTQEQSSGHNSNISFILQFSGIQMGEKKMVRGPFLFNHFLLPNGPIFAKNQKES